MNLQPGVLGIIMSMKLALHNNYWKYMFELLNIRFCIWKFTFDSPSSFAVGRKLSCMHTILLESLQERKWRQSRSHRSIEWNHKTFLRSQAYSKLDSFDTWNPPLERAIFEVNYCIPKTNHFTDNRDTTKRSPPLVSFYLHALSNLNWNHGEIKNSQQISPKSTKSNLDYCLNQKPMH